MRRFDGVADELGAHVGSHGVPDDFPVEQVDRGGARYSQPSAVGRQVMSPTSRRPGEGALKSRRIRSAPARP
jgi:hypothetical protein